ncbi:MAG TPA: hypothetical protein ENI05_09205 [Porticoccus sp.]|nr:hypothetical protein [Porticoccus sp.]
MMEKDRRELRKLIIATIRKFSMDPHHTPLKREQDRALAGRFIDKLSSSSFDAGSLPYYSKSGMAVKPSKVECVFALMCNTILTYWAIVHPQDGVDHELSGCYENDLKGHIARLNKVHDEFDTLKLLGDAKGYCLFELQRKDLYDKKESKSESEVQAG